MKTERAKKSERTRFLSEPCHAIDQDRGASPRPREFKAHERAMSMERPRDLSVAMVSESFNNDERATAPESFKSIERAKVLESFKGYKRARV